jgi:hypothetical protein
MRSTSDESSVEILCLTIVKSVEFVSSASLKAIWNSCKKFDVNAKNGLPKINRFAAPIDVTKIAWLHVPLECILLGWLLSWLVSRL